MNEIITAVRKKCCNVLRVVAVSHRLNIETALVFGATSVSTELSALYSTLSLAGFTNQSYLYANGN